MKEGISMTAERNHQQQHPVKNLTTRRRLVGLALTTATLAGAGVTIGSVAHAQPAVEIIDADVQRARIIAMSLDCEPRVGDDIAAIGCRWSTVDHAAGYRLVRVAPATDQGRTVVARIDDASVNTFVDSPVRQGVRYVYVVQALDANGRLIGASRPVHVGVGDADQPTDIEQLRLECSATSSTSVRCVGGIPNAEARTLTLWRSVDGAAREAVASFNQPFPSSYGDLVREGATQVHYAIIATNGDGEIVARSRAELVVMPRPTDVVPEPVRPEVVRPDTDARPDLDTPPVRDVPVRDVPVSTEPVRDAEPAPRDVAPPTTDARVDTRPTAPERETPERDTTVPDTTERETTPTVSVDAEPDDVRRSDAEPVSTRPGAPERTGRGG